MERLLEGRVAIITGAGRGIGRAAAELFAAHGARVVLSDIDPAPAEEAVGAIRAAGGQSISVVGDVTGWPVYCRTGSIGMIAPART